MYYRQTSGYEPQLAPDEIYKTEDQARARDQEIIIDRLSGLAPEVFDKMMTNGTTSDQDATLELLCQFGRRARYRADADEAPAVAMAAE